MAAPAPKLTNGLQLELMVAARHYTPETQLFPLAMQVPAT